MKQEYKIERQNGEYIVWQTTTGERFIDGRPVFTGDKKECEEYVKEIKHKKFALNDIDKLEKWLKERKSYYKGIIKEQAKITIDGGRIVMINDTLDYIKQIKNKL